jgi:single-strand DNA-binding protein
MAHNETIVTIRGNLAADPEHKRLSDGSDVVNFRIGSTPRHYSNGQFVDGPTSWYNVSAWRNIGVNCADSLRKGHPVIVQGRLKVRQWSDTDAGGNGRNGTSVDVDAIAVGHDLALGTTQYHRVVRVEKFERQGQEEVDEMLDRMAGRYDDPPAVDADGVILDPGEEPAKV